MDFNSLVEYIKNDGCKIIIYPKKKTVHGVIGTFCHHNDKPLISLATKGVSKKKRVEYLLHEYGHYLQWKEGLIDTFDHICNAYHIYDEWIEHKIELTEMEWSVARNLMLALEWDAEMRAYRLGKKLEVENFDPDYHLKGANGYMMTIKWSWLYRTDTNECVKRSKLKPKLLSKKELFAPLTRKEKEKMKKFKING